MDFLSALEPYAALGQGHAAAFAGVFARISALVFFLPGLGERMISMRVRLAAAMAIALVLAPLVAPTATAPAGPVDLALILAAEALAGAVIGFSIRIAIFAVQIAGHVAAQHLSLAQLFGAGLDDQPEPPVATLLTMAALTLAVAMGLHFQAVGALALSYEVMPYGAFPGASEAGAWAVERAAFAFSAGVALAMPFVVLGFIYYLAIGAANRAMPQLMVAFVGAPAITLAGLVMLALAAPPLLKVWIGMLESILRTLLGAAS
jgi:flagellar biosynthetic protein FliR